MPKNKGLDSVQPFFGHCPLSKFFVTKSQNVGYRPSFQHVMENLNPSAGFETPCDKGPNMLAFLVWNMSLYKRLMFR